MPYDTTTDLPDSVKDSLPKHAEKIYQKAFNNAWEQYKDPKERQSGKDREETAHSVAWAAVKKKYKKDTKGSWIKNEQKGGEK
ncbi:ChaB family protein [Candidatus Microgenomates bacterium]|nr:ChaB family protein [Candidatus Microgenomates bacterium]